jgi:hypothetical protein
MTLDFIGVAPSPKTRVGAFQDRVELRVLIRMPEKEMGLRKNEVLQMIIVMAFGEHRAN